jgi:serpin B
MPPTTRGRASPALWPRPFAAALLLTACADPATLPRVDPVAVPQEDVQSLAAATNAFAFDLYRELAEGDGNRFLSPFSIHVALSMTAGGAEGATAEELQRVMHLELPRERAQLAYQSLLADLGGALAKDGHELAIANALWLQEGLAFRPDFAAPLAKHFGAEMLFADFERDHEAALRTLERWVSERTRGRVQSLFAPSDDGGPSTRLLLASAIWFQGSWEEEFRRGDTRREPFHLDGGSTIETDLMHQQEHFAYHEEPGLQIVELPYRGGRASMLVLLPADASGLAALERRLDAATLANWTESLERFDVVLTLPRFEASWGTSLVAPLRSLGLSRAFDPAAAGLEGIADAEGLFLQAAAHAARIEVDEVGTRAAAATGVMVMAEMLPGGPKVFRADRPFLFLVRDRVTGTVLFLGRLARPE